MEFKFLRDQPLQTAKELKNAKFGHKDIAATLADIAQSCDTPFTIGLFGKWGSGKSTIANIVRDELVNRNVPVVVFDVWKHEGDSLRRSFLRECHRQLSKLGPKHFSQKYRLDERVEHAVTRVKQDKLMFNKELVRQLLKMGLFLVVVMGALAGGCLWLGLWSEFARWALAVFTSSVFAAVLVKLVGGILTTERTSYSTDRFEDPHQFEAEFGKIICAMKHLRALIVFDNIDRVTHGKAVEALATIKTFLEPTDIQLEKREIVFLIPCDDEAIRAHLQAVYKREEEQAGFEPDEFLRKFFNAVLWIPSFIPSELEAYTRACLARTNEPDLNDPVIAWLISKAYRNNPRQIIQFINTLLSNFLLMRSREGEGKDFEEGFAAQNKKQLCLYLLLTQIYPKEMSRLREARVLSLAEIPLSVLGNDDDEKKRFTSFVAEVSLEVTIDNLKLYYTLRRSEQEKRFPGIEELFAYLEDNQIEKAKDRALTMPSIREFPEDFGLTVVDELEGKTASTAAAYFINSLLAVLSDLTITLEQPVSGSILNVIKKIPAESIDVISPNELCENILVPYPHLVSEMSSLWMSRLSDIVPDDELRMKRSSFIHELMQMFAHNPHVAQPVLEKLRGVLAEHFAADIDVLMLFTETEENQNTFLSWALVKAFIDSIAQMDIASVPGPGPGQWKLHLLPTFSPSLFDRQLLAVAVAKLAQLAEGKSAEGWSADRAAGWQRFLESMQAFLCKHDLEPVALTDEFIGFGDSIIRLFDTIPDWPHRRLTVPVLMVLERFLPAPKLSEIQSRKVEFYRHAPLDAVKYCLPFAYRETQYLANPQYAPIFKDRSMKDPAFFNFFYEKLSDERRGQWFASLLKANPHQALSKLEEWKYDIPYKDLAIENILDSAQAADVPQKPMYYKACNAMKCNEKPQFIDTYAIQLKSLLRSTDEHSQQVAAEALRGAEFLEEGRERDIAKEVHEWLESRPLEEKYQHHALESIEMYADRFNPQERDHVMQYSFDYLIRRGTKVAPIDIGFRILRKYKPAYQQRKNNFDDVIRRAEKEPDAGIRGALIDGLTSLRPRRTNKHNEGFWEQVDSLGKHSSPDA